MTRTGTRIRPSIRHTLRAALATSALAFPFASLAQAQEPLAPLPAPVPGAPAPAPAPAVTPVPAAPPPPPAAAPTSPTELAPLAPLPGYETGPKEATDDDGGPLSGVELGLRAGLALPMGTLGGPVALSDFASNHIPIWADLGYRVSDRVMVGLYGQYGFLNPKCTGATTSCSGSDVRVGAEVHVHLLPKGATDPWLGAGVGYEWVSADATGVSPTGQQAKQSLSFHGFELLNLQAGVDWKASPALSVGPFMAFALGQYSAGSVNGVDGDIQTTAMHEWLTLGLRGTVR